MLLCLWPAVSGAMALVMGIGIGLFGINQWSTLTKPLATYLLQISVVGLGAGMNLRAILAVGASGVIYTVVGISFTFLLGLTLSKWFKLSRNLAIMLTSGTAICGGSAIAAVASVLKPKHEETTVALATVFLLNALALMIFPPLGLLFGFGQHEFGLWAALAIHDTSSVVGASASYGEEALKIATTTKLARALWIAPVAMIVGWVVSRQANSPTKIAGKIPVPWFILGFLCTALLVSTVPALGSIGSKVFELSKRSLVLTLLLIGANLSPAALRVVGWRPLASGIILWCSVSTVSALAIAAGWIQ